MLRHRISAAIAGGIVIAAVFAATLVVAPTQAQNAPTRPVDTDIRDYVIFGFQSVAIKGSDIEGRGIIRGGNVGANGVIVPGGLLGSLDATVNICANKHITMSQFSQVVGDVVRVSTNCTFWDVFLNRIVGGPSGPAHAFVQPVGPFPIVNVPPFPTLACNGDNPLTVARGSPPVTLAPGAYGDVEFQDGTTVTLTAGVYQICSLHLGQSVTVINEFGTILEIVGSLEIRNDSRFAVQSACSTFVYVGGQGVGANDSAINFGKDTTAAGHFFTLGRINLGNGTNLFGTFWGEQIISDFDLNVTFCPLIGAFPISKTISGPSAGLQSEIRIDVTCRPNPPNTTPIPPFIIPAGATGTVSTLVTGITLPATCSLTETNNGDNATVDVVGGGGGLGALGAEAPLCPDVGVRSPDLLTGEPVPHPGFSLDNVFELPTTTPTTTPTTAPTTTVPIASTTTIACVLPPEFSTLPPTTEAVSPVLPPTGGSGTDRSALVALGVALLGVVLVTATRRRPHDEPHPT